MGTEKEEGETSHGMKYIATKTSYLEAANVLVVQKQDTLSSITNSLGEAITKNIPYGPVKLILVHEAYDSVFYDIIIDSKTNLFYGVMTAK